MVGNGSRIALVRSYPGNIERQEFCRNKLKIQYVDDWQKSVYKNIGDQILLLGGDLGNYQCNYLILVGSLDRKVIKDLVKNIKGV